ncbi:hypothetical protein IB238_18760 [Rhizobium sp. ARZ01]|nr:hypothetical protein [Rhizobium sp. ARZ01]MBD9374670.1 hypothetical protein [Rhizobium sp. ARZ01]
MEPVSAAVSLDEIVAAGAEKEIILIAAENRIVALHGGDEDVGVVRAR